MASILRVKAKWSGFSGAPGYTVLHFRDFGTGTGDGADPTADQAIAAATRVRTFFDGIKSTLNTTTIVTIEPEVDVVEDTTGTLIDSYPAGTQAQVVGTVSGVYAGPAGAVANLRTGSVRNGRRIRGRIFLVPLATTAFNATGTIATGTATTINTALTTLLDSTGTPDLGVFARPSGPLATDGRWVVATAGSLANKVAVLRSRRD